MPPASFWPISLLGTCLAVVAEGNEGWRNKEKQQAKQTKIGEFHGITGRKVSARQGKRKIVYLHEEIRVYTTYLKKNEAK